MTRILGVLCGCFQGQLLAAARAVLILGAGAITMAHALHQGLAALIVILKTAFRTRLMMLMIIALELDPLG